MAAEGAFDGMAPPKKTTDPKGLGVGMKEYPRHLHKWAGTNEDGSPKLNDYIVVHSDADREAALAAGWSLTPVVEAPKAEKPKAEKPKGADKGATE